MSKLDHEGRAHAKLSASGSKQWLTCTPSIKLSEPFPDTFSEDAKLGTVAHELAENRLRWVIFKQGELYEADKEMLEYVTVYTNYVIERYHSVLADTLDAVILLEQRLDFSKYVPDGFGTGDVVLVGDNILEVIDLKYGLGVPVSAFNNTQLRLYALGAIETYKGIYSFETVRVTIVQPRLDSISSWDIDVEEIQRWGEEYVKPRALMAYQGEGEYISGDHCRWCKAKYICRKRAEDNLEMAKFEFRKPDLLTDDELNEILIRADELNKWVKDVTAYATEKVKSGLDLPGWELATGRIQRKIGEPVEAARLLTDLGFTESQIYSVELLGIGALEKLMGKKEFAMVMEPYLVKVEGEPKLKRRNGENK